MWEQRATYLIPLTVYSVIFLSTGAVATEKSNLFTFATQGAYTCGLNWWTAYDLDEISEETPNFTYKISKLVGDLMTAAEPGSYNTSLLQGLDGQLFKIIESALTLEPFYTVMLADIIIGLKVSSDEMEQVGLPRELADAETWNLIVKEYVDFSCTPYGVESVTDCVSNWTLFNCNLSEDKTVHITQWLDHFKDAYCDGGTSDPNVVKIFTKDFGPTSKVFAKIFGIVKDPQSPYLFTISQDSIFKDTNQLEKLSTLINDDCMKYQTLLLPIITELMKPDSDVGAGYIFKNMMGFFKSYAQCSAAAQIKVFPDLDTQSLIDKHSVLVDRYGISGFTPKFVPGESERRTVSVFGHSHLSIYEQYSPITCSVLGWQTYLFNDFFLLSGYSEPAAENSGASYVTKVKIEFYGTTENIVYLSEEGSRPSTRFNYSAEDGNHKTYSLEIVEVGEAVQITHGISGTVFVLQKYRETYYFTVRMGKDVFDLSYGLLTAGCFNSVDIFKIEEKSDAECKTACESAGWDYYRTCLFDCDVTGDKRVSQISTGIRNIERLAEVEDEKVTEVLGKGVFSMLTTEDGDDSSAYGVTAQMTVISVIFILRYI